jgi:hypothetical protein
VYVAKQAKTGEAEHQHFELEAEATASRKPDLAIKPISSLTNLT